MRFFSLKAASAFAGMSMMSTAYAEDFEMINREKATLTIHTHSFSISSNGSYAQFLWGEDRIKNDVQDGFDAYVDIVDKSVGVIGKARVNDVVPGVKRARNYISKDVQKKLQDVRNIYDLSDE